MTTTLAPAPAATPAQVRYINSLRGERALAALTHDEVNALGRRDASREIDRLLATPRVAAPAPRVAGGLFTDIPRSKYAIVEDGVLTFWEVKEFRGTAYLRLLIGAPGAFRRVRVDLARATRVVNEIRRVTAPAAALLFAQTYTCCAVCGAELSDETSVALGLGPICRRRFGL